MRSCQPSAALASAAAPAAARAGRVDDATARVVLRNEDVLRGQREVEIVHGDARYRLSVTAMGKLILTK